MNIPKNRPKSVDGVPTEALEEAAKIHEEGKCRFYRRNDKGTICYLDTLTLPIKQILEIEPYLKERWGGGKYYIQVWRTDVANAYLVPAFHVTLEGLANPINRRIVNNKVRAILPGGMAQVSTSQGDVVMPLAQAIALNGGIQNTFDPASFGGAMQPGAPVGMLPLPQAFPDQPWAPPWAPPQPPPQEQLADPTVEASVSSQPTPESQSAPPKESEGANDMSNGNNGNFGPFGQGFSPALQWAHGIPVPGLTPPAPGATMASDQALARMLEQTRQDAARDAAARQELITRLEERAKQQDAELTRMREESARRDAEAREQAHRLELKALQDRMDMMVAQMKESRVPAPAPEPAHKIEDWSKLIAAVAPILTVFIQSSQNQQAALLQTIAQPKADSSTEMLKTLAPLAGPLLIKMLENNGPEAKSALLDSVTTNAMQNMQMMSQLMTQMAQMQGGEELPPWVNLVKQVVGGAVEMFSNAAAAKAPRPQVFSPPTPQLPARTQPNGHAQNGQVQNSMYVTEPQANQAPETQATAPEQAAVEPTTPAKPNPETITKLVMQNVPESFRTPAWEAIIFNLHAEAPLEQIVPMIVDHLGELLENMPPELVTVIEQPRETLGTIVQQMPVMAYAPQYCIDVVEAVAAEISRSFVIETQAEETQAATPVSKSAKSNKPAVANA